MELIIGRDIEVKQANTCIKDFARQTLIFKNPKHEQNERLGFSNYNTPKTISLYVDKGQDLVLPFGTLKDLWLLKEKKLVNFTYTTNFKNKPVDKQKLVSGIKLEDYQEKALKSALKQKGGVIVMPCGTGKTNVGLCLLKELAEKTLWLCHTEKLLKQTRARALDLFPNLKEEDIGLITEGKVKVGQVLTISTIQTMTHLDLSKYENEWNIIIIDEAHHIAGSPTQVTMYYHILSNLCARYKYGLTATPKRADGLIRTLYALIGDKAVEITKNEVEQRRIPSTLEKVEIYTENNLSFYTSSYLFDQQAFNTFIATNKKRNLTIFNKIKKVYETNPTRHQLVLCERVAQCEELINIIKTYNETMLLNSKPIKATLFVGKNKKENKNLLDTYENYNVIVATYKIAEEGLDMPRLDTLHLASPIKNHSRITQCVGRIERKVEDKNPPITYFYEDINLAYCQRAYTEVRRALGIREYRAKKNKK